ncbi:MAG: hypothetical protein JWO37_329 [Acidimicrobiales bacterium]|jgi:hypothetical protein|nr:hypothetical protein [Acidimicrobiales bacterium]
MRSATSSATAAAIALAVLSACGGGAGSKAVHPRVPSDSSSTAAAIATATPPTSTTVQSNGRSTTTSARGSLSAPPSVSTNGPTAGSSPSPARAGTYRYRQSGSSTFGGQTSPEPTEGTLRVDQVAADGTQGFHRFVDPRGQPDDTTFLFRAEGIFVTRQVVRATNAGQTITIDCRFDPPLPAPPWPPATGRAFSGHGDCGNVTVDVNGRITGEQTVSLDGTTIRAWVLHFTAVTHGQIESTLDETDWFAPALAVAVHVDQHLEGHVGIASFRSDLVADIESGRPAG